MSEPAISTTESQSPEGQPRSEDEIRTVVRSIVIELSPERNEAAGREARLLEDLAYNSLALVELAFTLEDEFDLAPIEENTARRITTLGAVADHVVDELTARGELISKA